MTPVGDDGRPVERIELPVGAPLELDAPRREAVAANFAAMTAVNPKLWNGPFFLFEDVGFDGEVFRATA